VGQWRQQAGGRLRAFGVVQHQQPAVMALQPAVHRSHHRLLLSKGGFGQAERRG
jgi:hypothetical protein